MNRKLILQSLLLGLGLALASMAVPYRCCQNGSARGYPFAAYCPVCEATRFSIGTGRLGYFHVLDLPRFLGNILVWSGVSVGIFSFRARRAVG
jgi:hypothetical protein